MSPTAQPSGEMIALGRTVEVEDLNSGRLDRFTVVSSHDAAPRDGRLSEESPVGRALLGQFAGGTAQVHTPRGLRELRIISVS